MINIDFPIGGDFKPKTDYVDRPPLNTEARKELKEKTKENIVALGKELGQDYQKATVLGKIKTFDKGYGLRIRDDNGNRIGTAYKGEEVRILGRKTGVLDSEGKKRNFLKIGVYDNKGKVDEKRTGWVAEDFVEVDKQETPKPAPTDKPKDAPKPAPTDKPKDAPKPAPTDKPKDAPKPAPTDKPKDAPKPAPTDKPKDAPKPAPTDKPKDAPKPAPTDKPKDAPKPAPTDKPKDAPKPAPTDKPKDAPKPAPTDKPKDAPKPAPTDKPKDAPKPAETTPAPMSEETQAKIKAAKAALEF